jgi:hypothetical protein
VTGVVVQPVGAHISVAATSSSPVNVDVQVSRVVVDHLRVNQKLNIIGEYWQCFVMNRNNTDLNLCEKVRLDEKH